MPVGCPQPLTRDDLLALQHAAITVLYSEEIIQRRVVIARAAAAGGSRLIAERSPRTRRKRHDRSQRAMPARRLSPLGHLLTRRRRGAEPFTPPPPAAPPDAPRVPRSRGTPPATPARAGR